MVIQFSKICTLLQEYAFLCQCLGQSIASLQYSKVLRLTKDIQRFTEEMQTYRRKKANKESEILMELNLIIADLLKGH